MRDMFDYLSPPASAVARIDWTPTRAAGLARLEAFAPKAGRAYAAARNVDRGPEDRSNVSCLSPWLRRRMLTEEEVLSATLARHSPASAEKFIQEVYWRAYWKGWLEIRPAVYRNWVAARDAVSAEWRARGGRRKALEAAEEGATGIACFDAFARELAETGWMHNHARMWFASIWIFTLDLPWELGADLFFRRLIDADAASNTLSWRWVAGLHTIGKHYVARAHNIRMNTGGRFDPRGELNESPEPLRERGPAPTPGPLPAGEAPPSGRFALLLTEEDLHPESLLAGSSRIAGIAALAPSAMGRREEEGAAARRFSDGAIADALARGSAHFGAAAEPGALLTGEIVRWAKGLGVDTVVTAYAPVGPAADTLATLRGALVREGIALRLLQRPYDAAAWPHAKAGFFKMREKIPALLAALDSPRGPAPGSPQ